MADDVLRPQGVGEPDGLDRLWTPYRMAYIRGEERPSTTAAEECPYCRITTHGNADGLEVHRAEIRRVPNAAFGPVDGLLGASCGVQLVRDEQMRVPVGRQVGRVYGDHQVDVATSPGQVLHQRSLGPAGARHR